MQEGTPITFSKHRHSKRSKLPMYSNGGEHLGVFVSSFNQMVKAKRSWQSDHLEPKARVYSPYSRQLHTCELNTMHTIEGKSFNPDSIIGLHWEALVKTMPVNLVVRYDFIAFRLQELEFRSRSTHLVNILPRDWPVQTEFRKVIESWTPQACQIPHHTDRENVVQYGDCLISSNFNSASVLRRGNERTDSWLRYDPALQEQHWQGESRNLLKEMMLRYEMAKKKGFKKEETTNE